MQLQLKPSHWTAGGMPRHAGGAACLHELFEAQADAGADAPALVCGAASLTYGELEVRANRLAHALRSLGVRPGSFVGLCMQRSELPIVAILACLKAGGAYVPLDPGHPDERIRFIVHEAAIGTILTETALAERLGALGAARVVALDDPALALEALPGRRLTRAETGLAPSDPCYVLYTSGTTGRPKGVVAEHRNVVHFVGAFNQVCTTTRADRVFQGFSLGFDGSTEEIWMAFSNGATLVAGTRDTPRFGNDLARHLRAAGVTYLSTVPTLLSTMTEDVPSLRQLVVSGEACPPELVARWARRGRRMLNVYGPTEATVNTTAAVLEPGRPVTIGHGLDGYATLVLDERMQPVAPGSKGELYVGGPGVARGYLAQPGLTARAFVEHAGQRLYRTGDLVRISDDGELEFFGRIDGQVKIRGYRVELAEIEAVLLEEPHIAGAAVRLCERQGMPVLAAHVVLRAGAGSTLDRGPVLQALRARLPAYMVPAYLDVIDALPMLASGKVDRKRLPQPVTPLVAEADERAEAATPLERQIAAAWAELFDVAAVGAEQDFFLDLGGHSLLAAQLVALLRKRAGIGIAVRDVYAHPTVRRLALHVAAAPARNPAGRAPAAAEGAGAPRKAARPRPGWRAVAFQVAYLLALIPLFSLPLVIVVPPVMDMLYLRRPILDVVLFLMLVGLALWPLMLLIGIGAKWLLIGRYKPGAYPLWGSYYLRWWVVSRLQGLSGLGAFGGTPLAPVMWRLMGARVGRHCMLQTGLVSAWDCVSIGDDTSIGADTQLTGVRIEDGYLRIGRVDIGSRCFVGAHSALGLGVAMGDDSRLDDQSLLPDGETIPAGQFRRGSPAREARVAVPDGPPRRLSRARLTLFCIGQMLTALVLGLTLGLPALALALGAAFMIVHVAPAVWVPALAGAVPLLIVFSCFYVAGCKKLVQPRPRPGVYHLYSLEYLRFWLTSGMMRAVRGAGMLIFTTIYLPPWMRLLGARLGRHTEMSTVWSVYPDMLSAGDGVFFADGCLLGASRTHLGRFSMQMTTIGNRSFIGNSAMLPAGSGLGDNCLLGVLSAPPEPTQKTPDGTDWLGSPGFRLPNRLKVAGFAESTTYRPTPRLYLQRAAVDALRILIPAYLGAALATAAFLAVLAIYNAHGVWAVYAAAPFIGWSALVIAVAAVVVLKWTVMGTFKPVVVPLWSAYVWFNEMINGVYEAVMAPVVAAFFGTPFAAPLLRLMGCKVGRHCYIGTSLFSEFDLVDIGDHVALNGGAVIQNHLFEDRIMKSSHLRIDDGCSVGNMAVVLYDTRMGAGAVLGPMSLLMKGETMPGGSRWHGIPTVQG
jgi:non-ribosomal peptide synthetase-like protein